MNGGIFGLPTEIWKVGTDAWISDINYPPANTDGASMTTTPSGTSLIVSPINQIIYKVQCTGGHDHGTPTCSWSELPTKLAEPRQWHFAMYIPEEIFQCFANTTIEK